MNNYERFEYALGHEKADRIMTYDLLDNVEILKHYGGYDPSRSYSFEELVGGSSTHNSGAILA